MGKGELRSWANTTMEKSGGKSTTRSSPVLRSPKKEGNLFREISFIVLDTIVEFIKDFKEEMLTRQSVFCGKVLGVLIHLLGKNQSISFLSGLFATLVYLITDFKRYDNNRFLIDDDTNPQYIS